MNDRENWLYPDASSLYFIHDGFIMRATDGKQYDIEEECDLLNEQQAEIMRLIIQLKCINQIKPLKKEIPDSIDIVISNDVELLQNFKDENKQLKSQLHCDDENGVCNICKHHYLVKDNESEFGYYNSRCKKGHYECARISLKHCEDFELKEGDVE